MIMTTPNEFLQFAKDMGLGRIKSTSSSSSSPSRSISNNNNYSTGLCVLNNLCCLIEQIHELKTENSRLRAHLELDDHFDKFQQRFLLKDHHKKNKNEKHKQIISSTIPHNEEKSKTLSPTSSLKTKQSKSNPERKGSNYGNHQEDSSSMLQIDHEQSEMIDSNSGLSSAPTWNHWNKVRHALKFSLRRKQDYTNSPPLPHGDRQIPMISISVESDDDHIRDNKRLTKKKKKKIITTNENQQMIIGEDTDQDDESTQFVRAYHKRRLYGDHTPTSSSTERQEASSTNIRSHTSNIDDDTFLTRKQSKIAQYRRKLRSKLDIVKRQFSDQNVSTSIRLFHTSPGSTLDDIEVNHALLTAQLAPALTKSYQQKMREWETMQKSHFLVNYRRKSVAPPKLDFNSNSRKSSIINETSPDRTIPSLPIDNCSSSLNELNLELETNLPTFGPILSPNQRSLIAHQWREIMSEEISLRHYDEYLQKKMILLKELETSLKTLKTNIFCTNNSIKQQSIINIREHYHYEQSYLPQRCHSLQTLISMPASWILAVQSAAYSDVLDGTSNKTTERAILFNKDFFDQLEQFKRDRQKFEQDSIKDLQLLNRLKTNRKQISNDNRTHVKFTPLRGHLRKLSLIESSEFPEHFLPDPIIPLQITISQLQPLSNIEHHSTAITNEIDSNIKTSSLPDSFNKRSKRSRFDFKETFHHSRSICAGQINSWLQRRLQRYLSLRRRKSTTENKIPKILGSPRLARLHQRIFKHQALSIPQTDRTPIPVQILDDSDNRSQSELPVRIYFPPLTAPAARYVRITDINIVTSDSNDQETEIEQTSDITTLLINRKYSSSSSTSLKTLTAKERRQSFATLSHIFNNKYL